MTRVGDFARNEFSQCGEDGIVEHLISLLELDAGYCVEFGAGDGVTLSNTHNLIRNHGWNGLLIEADDAGFQLLVRNLAPFSGVDCVHRTVSFEGSEALTRILVEAAAPTELHLLSIDIDGNDYHVWDSLEDFRPKIVIIEFNQTIPNHIAYVQARDMRVRHGSSLRSLTELAARKGYLPVAATDWNGIYVREDLALDAGLGRASLDELRPGHEWETNVLQLFDGTVVYAGLDHSPWHQVKLPRPQMLPRFLRSYPDHGTAPAAGAFRVARFWSRIREKLRPAPGG